MSVLIHRHPSVVSPYTWVTVLVECEYTLNFAATSLHEIYQQRTKPMHEHTSCQDHITITINNRIYVNYVATYSNVLCFVFSVDMLAARKLVKPMTVDDATPTNPHGSDFSFSDDEALCQMIDMGFDLEESQIALRLFDGKIDEAIDAISSHDPNLLHALEVTPTVSQKQPL